MPTEEQKKRSAERLAEMQAPVPETPAPEEAAAIRANYTVMMGHGEDFLIGPYKYKIAPFVIGKLRDAFDAIAQVPAIIVALALGTEADETIQPTAVAAEFNRITRRTMLSDDPEAQPFDDDMIVDLIDQLPDIISRKPETLSTVLAPLVMNLQRNHPSITEADLLEAIDLPTCVAAYRVMFRQNATVKAHFPSSSA